MDNIFETRQDNLKKRLIENKIKGLAVFKDENIFYLTVFYGNDTGSIVLITQKETVLLTHFIHFENAVNSVSAKNTRIVKFLGKKFNKLSEILCEMDLTLCGFEGDSIS